MILKRRNLVLSSAWIASVILVSGLLWGLTQSLRTNILIRQANRVIARTGDTRRLNVSAGAAAGLGTWFSLAEVPGNASVPGRVLVFTLMNGTQTAACAAFVDMGGNVEKIVPLSDYAELVVLDLPEVIYDIYSERIKTLFRLESERERRN